VKGLKNIRLELIFDGIVQVILKMVQIREFCERLAGGRHGDGGHKIAES
jgi:hypothetical protein